mmetsp:Transcript_42293/g.108165  ORF Transcript_42293/g.108165 Transcript_42293/m.108165 type:complete len:401 (+) Transcript_42293:127-1329(+)
MLPGAMTVSPPAAAAMLRLSLPPSMAMPRSIIKSRMATALSYMSTPSVPSLAACIQLTLLLTSPRAVTLAHVRLVRASPTARRAMAAGSTSPLMGASPMEVARPTSSLWLCAMTAQLESGSSMGPTHCCCATRPVTLRSTLVVRKRLEQTAGCLSTTSSASLADMPPSSSGLSVLGARVKEYVFWGMSPSTASRSRSTAGGSSGAALSFTTMRPLSVTVPMICSAQRSRAQISSITPRCSGRSSRQSFSWYSAPQISSTLRVSSPSLTARTSTSPPHGYTISFTTLQLPPAPWSCRLTMGLESPISTQARTTRHSFWLISASPRCTALKSSSALLEPLARLDAAPPPMPMRYAGPPIFTISMPGAGSSLSRWAWSIWPMPALNMMGLSHSRRSPLGWTWP